MVAPVVGLAIELRVPILHHAGHAHYPLPDQPNISDGGDLRELKPELFVSVTTGTWPSPYWLWHGDSIWRQGRDYGFHGKGSKRLQWLTYRDMTLHKMIVRRGPLYPINSLMIVGVAYGKHILPADMGGDLKELTDEFRMLFGSGTQNLELYISPEMMTPAMWDRLAEAARSRSGQRRRAHSTCIGLGAIRAAARAVRIRILTRRERESSCFATPPGQPATLDVDVETAFELPPRRTTTLPRAKPLEGLGRGGACNARRRPSAPVRAGTLPSAGR